MVTCSAPLHFTQRGRDAKCERNPGELISSQQEIKPFARETSTQPHGMRMDRRREAPVSN